MFCSIFLRCSPEDAEFVAGCRTQRRTLFTFTKADLSPWNAWVRLGVQSKPVVGLAQGQISQRVMGSG